MRATTHALSQCPRPEREGCAPETGAKMTPPKQENNRASMPRELEAVLQEVAALGEPNVWDEKVEWRLCERARLVRGESLPGFDVQVGHAIYQRQRQLVRKQVRELMGGQVQIRTQKPKFHITCPGNAGSP